MTITYGMKFMYYTQRLKIFSRYCYQEKEIDHPDDQ